MTIPEPAATVAPSKLHVRDREILTVLDETAGWTTSRIGQKISKFGSNAHQQTGAALSWLRDLEKRHLVARLDDDTPIAWVRTPAGTAALESSP